MRKKDDVMLASLPFFHSFGCTVTLWYPLIEGFAQRAIPHLLKPQKSPAWSSAMP
jgi:acyl-[acyl-carrier-protein]-phospholipid O-acyltransferase/long-chain-fatty-acid--[acyl-carrier-protein] ligase